MSAEIDPPRQRTVAELLAENGGPVTGRRRRRRDEDEADGTAPPDLRTAPPAFDPFAPAGRQGRAPEPHVTGRGDGPDPRPPAAEQARRLGSIAPAPVASGPTAPAFPAPPKDLGSPSNGISLNGGHAPPSVGAPEQPPSRFAAPQAPPERPTEVLPRVRDVPNATPRPSVEDFTGPIDRYPGTATTGLPPGGQLPPADPADPDSRGHHGSDGHPEPDGRAAPVADPGPPTQAARLDSYDDHPAGLPPDVDPPGGLHPDLDPTEIQPARRLGRPREDESTGGAWAAVIVQWIAGALAGAGLWVGFRFLWFNLPVVALAAAVLVTVGLVLGVRTLLRNDDLRTTIFAVLVGLLLTVSPAILVLLGR
ncbi:hypothetical protein ACFQE5_14955 [Pseudonocardia hispaniensis]|uniref:Uncharacterized protein n=1 Tax=Pseudonocardia hispaniensis TaxID=904933 RepID=A0ABW1J531_9PSEU